MEARKKIFFGFAGVSLEGREGIQVNSRGE
jgi:hypothetical protein